MFPDARIAKAVVDRLTHRAHIIDTGTESWRFRHGLNRTQARPDPADRGARAAIAAPPRPYGLASATAAASTNPDPSPSTTTSTSDKVVPIQAIALVPSEAIALTCPAVALPFPGVTSTTALTRGGPANGVRSSRVPRMVKSLRPATRSAVRAAAEELLTIPGPWRPCPRRSRIRIRGGETSSPHPFHPIR